MITLSAIADPTRRRILETLARGPRTSGEIAALFDISAPAVSQHLGKLRNARLVDVRTDAQRRIYELRKDGLDELTAWIEELQLYWSDKFERLDAALQEDRTGERPWKRKE